MCARMWLWARFDVTKIPQVGVSVVVITKIVVRFVAALTPVQQTLGVNERKGACAPERRHCRV